MKPKVIITAYAHPILKTRLEDAGYKVIEYFDVSYEELLGIVHEFHGMIVTTRLKIDKAIIDRAIQLKWIGRLGSGMELIDHEYAKLKNIKCVSSPEGNRDTVGEQVVGMILSLMHHIDRSANQVRKGQWLREENRATELGGKTVGIIGYGHTGGKLAQLLSSFGVKILAHDKYKSCFSAGNVFESSLEDIKVNADVISFHLPLTKETLHYANDEFFGGLKKKPVIINASRGKIVDTQALLRALDTGKISSAGLDVLENENLTTYTAAEKESFDNLVSRTNVLVTPHIAGYSHEALIKMAEVLIVKLGIR